MDKTNSSRILWILTFGVFGLLSMEMGATGLVPIIAEKFSVDSPTAGWSVSIFALTITLCAPIVPFLTARFNQKTLMIVALSVFTLSAFLAMFVEDFWLFLVLRAIPAFFHPIYVTLALGLAAQSVANPKDAPKAVAKVFSGVSAGMVLGVSLATYLGASYGFSISMAFFALLNLATLIATICFMPALGVGEKPHFKSQIFILKEPLLWVSFACVICLNGAMFGFSSYLSEFLDKVTKMPFSFISIGLFVYGLTNIVGNIIAGHSLAKMPKATLLLTPLGMMALYYVIFVFESEQLILACLIAILGVFAGVANNSTHYMITEPFPHAQKFTDGLFLSVGNLGVTFGTAICGLFITHFGTSHITIASILMLCSFLICLFVRNYLGSKTPKPQITTN